MYQQNLLHQMKSVHACTVAQVLMLLANCFHSIHTVSNKKHLNISFIIIVLKGSDAIRIRRPLCKFIITHICLINESYPIKSLQM